MAFGSSKPTSGKATVFVDLRTAAAKGKEGVGFRQETARTQVGDSIQKTFAMHDFVSGKVIGFKVNEEPTYDDKDVKELICYLTLGDPEPDSPNVTVRFPMSSYSGRRMVGLVHQAIVSGHESVHIRASFAEAGQKLGDRVLDKNMAFVTLRGQDSNGPKLNPLYASESGEPLVDASGLPLPLPEPTEVTINRKVQKDYTDMDNVVAGTAMVLMHHFESLRESRKQVQGAADVGDFGLDPAEAAAAAATAAKPQTPRG